MSTERGIFVLLAVLLVLACVQQTYASRLVIGVEADIISSDPMRSPRHGVTDLVLGLIYDTLVTNPHHDDYGFGVAQEFRPITARQWEFKIKSGQGIDATQVTAALNRSFGFAPRESATPARDRLTIQRAHVSHENLVLIDLFEPLPSLPIMLSHEYLAIPSGGKLEGTGPYALERREHGNRIVLERRDPADTNLPEQIVFEVIPATAERIARLRSGRIDVLPSVPAQFVSRLEHSDIELLARPATRSYFIEMNTSQPPFNDARVRKALNLAVDIPAMLCAVYSGIGSPLATIVTPTTFGFHSELTPIEYNVAEARRLLAEAGYPEGFAFELDSTPQRMNEMKFIAKMWEAVGVTTYIRQWPDWSSLKAAILHGDRFAWTAEWNNTSLDPASIIGAKTGSGGIANYGQYANATINGLLAEAQQAQSPEHYLALFRTAQEVLRDDAAMVFGYSEEVIMARRFGVSESVLSSPNQRLIHPHDSGGC